MPQTRAALESKSLPELKDECKAAGIGGYSKKRKEELVDLLLRKKPRPLPAAEVRCRPRVHVGRRVSVCAAHCALAAAAVHTLRGGMLRGAGYISCGAPRHTLGVL